MTETERDELEAVAEVQDVVADAVIAEADADLADLAQDAAAELEQDLELEEAIVEAKEEAAAVDAEVNEGGSDDPCHAGIGGQAVFLGIQQPGQDRAAQLMGDGDLDHRL